MSFSLKAVAKHSACLLPPASRPPHHVAPSKDLKRCSRRGRAGWRNWKKIIPNCTCWQGLTPTWWNIPSSCLWEQASSCEWLLRFRACKVGCRMITRPEARVFYWSVIYLLILMHSLFFPSASLSTSTVRWWTVRGRSSVYCKSR